MPNRVKYEWGIQHLDEEMVRAGDSDPDILETDHSDEFPGFVATHFERLVLIRDEWNEDEGLVDRSWADVENGMLPARFNYGRGEDGLLDLGPTVPKRFHRLLAKECRR